MDLNQLLDKYIENQNKLNEIKGSYFSSSEDRIIEGIQELSDKQRAIFFENDEILKKTVYYYRDNFDKIDEEVYNIFRSFVLRISKVVDLIDAAIAYEVSVVLLKYVESLNDINRIVELNYQCGLLLFSMSSKMTRDKLKYYFDVAKRYMHEYFNLNKSGKDFFNRCMGNRLLAQNRYRERSYKEIINLSIEIIDFFSRKDVLECEPEFDLDYYETIIFVTKKNTLVLLDRIREEGNYDDESMELLYQYSIDIYNKRYLATSTKIPVLLDYIYAHYAISYHTNRITLEEFCDKLYEISQPEEDDLYSLESRKRAIRGRAYICYYLDYSKEDKNVIYEKKNKIIYEILEYIRSMPISAYERLVQFDIMAFLACLKNGVSEEEAITIVKELTIYRHLPTYVHIKMVSLLSSLILRYAIKFIPSYFVGMLDLKTEEDVINNSEKLNEIIIKSSLLHDIGKFFCLECVNNYGRKLTDIEFEIIKNHPQTGYEILKGLPINSIYIEAALYHHIWHDLKGGYPVVEENANIQTRKLIDIITIADSIDAATDNLGRPYAKGKTLSELKVEFKDELRYSKELVKLLDNEELTKELEGLISNQRTLTTIEAYKLFAKR